MDRVIQSRFAQMNLCTPVGGSLGQINKQLTLQSSRLWQDQGNKTNRRGITHFSSLHREPKLFSCQAWCSGFLKQDYKSQFLQFQTRYSAENFAGSVEAFENAEPLSKNITGKDSLQKERIVNSSSLLVEDVQKHRNNLVTCIGAVILLSALTLISIRPAFAISGVIHTNAGAKGGASAAVAVGEKAASSFLRSELLGSAWTGLVAGCLHTLTGPDHLAALAPLSIGRTRMESAAVGALWGCGHDAGQLIFGILFLILKDKLQIELLRSWGARVVGITLLIIGGMGIKEASEVPEACVALESGHHQANLLKPIPALESGKKNIRFATFATGIVHGLQPDALLMVLPALALPSRLAGGAFLLMFLVGTVMAMGGYTAFIGSCSDALKTKIPRITEGLSWGSSLIAIALGGAILLSEVFGINLF
ncbi:hypothetical protein SUGI_0307170 [Cryptomeria japonica]|uniref:chloroplast protein FOR GROWTH AND FERTILITY 2 n=1 Tax=Cryptomeria japonica TaxID=3369 RepID=UPI002408EC75|nr:chloroplast protein FOR GROWTH AND FERTILITY 2 [Cryptomeria japonica]GLJ17638.1 hypothetical protein SUGI_0307170 [Cryptomeria japonica]